jgi:hypothetical protein
VATTVDVVPATASVVEGATATLTATVKDQNGATMSGQSVTWATSTLTTASVTQAGVVTGVAAGSATITANVAGKSGTSTITVTAGPRIEVEASKAVTAMIGSLGGSLTTSVGAATYILSVPPGSLLSNVQIVMTPVTALRKLPAGGEFAGGVVFGPTGLTFPKAATLRVVEHVTPVAGKELYGYLANDTGAVVALSPMTRKGDTLTLRIPHFTVGGWGQFVPPQVALLPPTLPSNTGAQGFTNQLAALTPGTSVSTALAIVQQWFTTLIAPELSNPTGNNTTEDVQAANDFDSWDTMVSTYDFTLGYNGALMAAAAPLRQQGVSLLPQILKFGIAGLISDCETAAANGPAGSYPEQALTLQEMAEIYHVDNQFGLDRQSVLNMLRTCVRVINTQANFPANPTPNAQAQLDVRYGVQFGTNPALADVKFKVNITLAGTTTDGTQVAQTDDLGAMSGTVVPTGQRTFVADLVACIHPSLSYRFELICTSHQVTRSFGVTLTGDVTVRTQTGLASLSNVAKVTGSLTIGGGSGNGDPITSTDLHELAQLSEVGKTLSISFLPSLVKLDGLRGLTKVGGAMVLATNLSLNDISALSSLTQLGGLTLESNASLASLHGLEQVTSLDANGLYVRRMPLLVNLAGLLGLRSTKTLWLEEDPLLTSLQALRGTTIPDEFYIVRMIGLTTLKDLTGLPAVVNQIVITENPLLRDLAALANLTSTTRNLSIYSNPLLPNLHELSNVTSVGLLLLSGGSLTSTADLAKLKHVDWISIPLAEDSPFLSTIVFPALQDATGQHGTISVTLSTPSCNTGRSVSVSFPALTTATSLSVGSGYPGALCSISVSAPALTTGSFGVGGGVTSLSLGASLTGVSVSISGTSLTTLNLPTLHVEDLRIRQNRSLTSIGSGSGRVTKNFEVWYNDKLSTAAIGVWMQGFTSVGRVFIDLNGIP